MLSHLCIRILVALFNPELGWGEASYFSKEYLFESEFNNATKVRNRLQ